MTSGVRRFSGQAIAALLGLAVALGVAGCSRTTAIDELRNAIAAYGQGTPEATAEKIDALFAQVDADVAALRARAATQEGDARASAEQEADDLARQRRELHAEYLKARFARAGDAAGQALQSAGEAIGKGIEEMGRKIRESAAGGAPGGADERNDGSSGTSAPE